MACISRYFFENVDRTIDECYTRKDVNSIVCVVVFVIVIPDFGVTQGVSMTTQSKTLEFCPWHLHKVIGVQQSINMMMLKKIS